MVLKSININVYNEIGADAAISVEDGINLFEKIDNALSNNLEVILDFQNIDLIITAFLNAAIGQLYSKYTSEQLNDRLKLINVKAEDRRLFKTVIERAKEYFANDNDFQNILKDNLGDD